AQNATWTGPGNDWNTGSNWSGNGGAQPSNIATFTNNGAPTSLTFSSLLTNINTIQFNAGTPTYTFTLNTLEVNGLGIVNNSSFAPIFNVSGNLANLFFNSGSTAGNATITISNNGVVEFANTSTAGSATITNNGGVLGGLFFEDTSTAGMARLINRAARILDLSHLDPSAGMTAGSIEGAGSIFLGSKNLAVGGNNLSTTFAGVLQDGGISGGAGGSLTKVGSGTLTLSGVNSYSGGTTVTGGLINFNSASNFRSGPITPDGGGLPWAIGTSTRTSRKVAPLRARGRNLRTHCHNLT